jgi:hypothetical protein
VAGTLHAAVAYALRRGGLGFFDGFLVVFERQVEEVAHFEALRRSSISSPL